MASLAADAGDPADAGAADAGAAAAKWYFPDLPQVLGIERENPVPARFRGLKNRMTPADAGKVLPGAEKTTKVDRGEGDFIWRSELDASSGDGVISLTLDFSKSKGRLGLESATLHFSQARATNSFYGDLLRAVTEAFGSPAFENGHTREWPWGGIVEEPDHYAYRTWFEPRAFVRMKSLKH
jgi:hypothetical protein